MTEEIIIDGVNVAGCEYMLNNKIKGKQHCPAKAMPYAKETSCICRKSIDTPYNFCKHNPNCHYKQLKQAENTVNECHKYLAELEDKIERLEQENKELSKLIRGTKDYAEVCSVCKDEVTIYPNISGRTNYTQNEVECRTLAQIITRKNNLEQENKELKEKVKSRESELANMTEQANMRINTYRSALEEINILAKNYCNACDEFKAKTYKNKNDCLYCNYGFIKRKINEVLTP